MLAASPARTGRPSRGRRADRTAAWYTKRRLQKSIDPPARLCYNKVVSASPDALRRMYCFHGVFAALLANGPSSNRDQGMIILINGPCGIGKTAISWELITRFDRAVMLDGDYIGAVHPFEIYDDALRTDPELPRQYRELKEELSRQHRQERAQYSGRKGDFIGWALARFRMPPQRQQVGVPVDPCTGGSPLGRSPTVNRRRTCDSPPPVGEP